MKQLFPQRCLASAAAMLLAAVVAGCGLLNPAPPAVEPATRPVATLAPVATVGPGYKSGGTVTVYSALSDASNSAIIAAFEKAQPVIGVNVLSLAAAGDLESHIRSERDVPKADVFLGGSSEFHDSLGKEGLLDAYRSPSAASVDPTLKDPAGYWTGWYLGVFGIATNTERWARDTQSNAPTSWDDLLDPSLAGKIVMPDPATTGGGYIFLANQLFRLNRDESRAMEYMKRLHANVAQYTETSPRTIDLAGAGEYPVGLNWGHDVLTAAARGQPLTFTAPENTSVEVGAVSVVKGGPNPTGARTLVDWVLSREAAQLIVKLSNRISVIRGVAPAPGAPNLDTVKLVNYDRAWATANRDRLLRDWRAAVGR